MRKALFSVACALVLTLGSAGAALAADDDPESYAPQTHSATTPTLSGSTVSPACSADVPWITFSVVLTDPDDVATGHTARLVLSNGSQSVTLTLGELVGNRLSGTVLWPGASVGADGRGNGWPGWTFSGGEWVETSGNFAWTRGNITATLEVNPSLAVPLSYPPSTPQCLTSPPLARALTAGVALPATGGDSAALAPLLWGAGTLVLVGGGVLLLARRTRRTRD